jgi:hypothetical protein
MGKSDYVIGLDGTNLNIFLSMEQIAAAVSSHN